MSYYAYAFTGRLETHALGTYTYRVVFLPPELEAALPFGDHPRLRFEGEIADVPVKAAWQPAPGRGRYAMVSPELCRLADLHVGDPVEVRFNLAPQDAVDVPEPLQALLDADPELAGLWDALPPGKKRGVAYLVAAAKTERTLRKRIDEAAVRIRTGDLRTPAGRLLSEPAP